MRKSGEFMSQNVQQQIESILRETFSPIYLKVQNDSARHRGHAGAMQTEGNPKGPLRGIGETHFQVEIVAEVFEGKSLLERHRAVNEALKELLRQQVHALQIKTLSPSEQK